MNDELRPKTETIKDRAIYIYLPSLEMVKDWKGRARKSGVSISKFVIERVEDSLRNEEGEESYLNKAKLVKKLRDSEDELKKVRSENGLLKKLAVNLDNEHKHYRAQPFLEKSFEGIRRFDKERARNLLRDQNFLR
jgi:hypothetical protein